MHGNIRIMAVMNRAPRRGKSEWLGVTPTDAEGAEGRMCRSASTEKAMRYKCSGRSSASEEVCDFCCDSLDDAMDHYEAFDHDVEDTEEAAA